MPTKVRMLALALLLCAGCQSKLLSDTLLGEGFMPAQPDTKRDAGEANASPDAATAPGKDASMPAPKCVPAASSDALPARAATMTQTSGGDQTQIFTRDLFNLFRSHCGGCHVDANRGGLQVSLSNFPQTITQTALSRILADDPARYMPPSGPDAKPFSTRAAGDPVVELATLLEQWLGAGSPPDRFVLVNRDTSAQQSPYQLDTRVGMGMTNLGSCIPPKQIVGRDTDAMAKLDKLFAGASELPEKLQDTDLVSLDSEVLARQGVISFAPAYTLWADDAKKARAVRVPAGKAIVFDKQKQLFTIPANTRFYKTFFKGVIDDDGRVRYRKIETRLIVSRPDEPTYNLAPHPRSATKSLFGTYVWNDAETEAVLLRDPLRDGKPWRDHVLTVITDAPGAKKVSDAHPDNIEDALEKAGVTRTYALPSSERCWQCHLGSDNASFVLGFTPLQLHRRPVGEGGVLEPAERDELNQLQRLIDYGVIQGMASPKDVVLLEDSQGERKPRNDHELQAQGYMLGNCAHCHNDNGYPLSIAPELDELLDFRPSAEGGIFQFPLERFSPRIRRGPAQDQLLPYITPSVLDRIPNDQDQYAAKVSVTGPFVDADGNTSDLQQTIFAPWRSLIYRNVDAPFSYAEDSAIYPHMPANTPGYDCRVRRLLGTWMASIPALMKDRDTAKPDFNMFTDVRAQPFEEIHFDPKHPEAVDWQRALSDANTRVGLFQSSLRYTSCKTPDDIVDPDIVHGRSIVPAPVNELIDNADGTKTTINLFVPARPHFAVTDLTDPPGDWAPRRSDWKSVLVDRSAGSTRSDTEATAVALVQSVTLTDDFKSYATTDLPFGLWEQKGGCDFSQVKRVADYQGSSRPAWMSQNFSAGVKDGTAPVYEISPGAEVFTTICANCHGPLADSKGRVAATIADMTGGETRVANLRAGIFGPIDDPMFMPGHNRAREFGMAAGGGVTADDWAARYAVWMGLGGTQRIIPPAILAVVGNSVVLGQRRAGFAAPRSGANMLTVAQVLCGNILPEKSWSFDLSTGAIPDSLDGPGSEQPAVIKENGDWEMWQKLCVQDNPLPVRVVRILPKLKSDQLDSVVSQQIVNRTYTDQTLNKDFDDIGLYRRAGYPANYPVGDDQGHILPKLTADVRAPWCFEKPSDPGDLANAQLLVQQFARGNQPVPFCPDALFAAQAGKPTYQLSRADVNAWTMRGAMNAGLAVFVYLDALTSKKKEPVIPYTGCDNLPKKP